MIRDPSLLTPWHRRRSLRPAKHYLVLGLGLLSLGLNAEGGDWTQPGRRPEAMASASEPYLAAALKAESQNQLNEAQAWLERGIDLPEATGDLWLSYGRVLLKQGRQIDLAREAFQKSLSLAGFSRYRAEDAAAGLYRAWRLEGRAPEAVADLERRFSPAVVARSPDLAAESVRVYRAAAQGAKGGRLMGLALEANPTSLVLATLALETDLGPISTINLLLDRSDSSDQAYADLLWAYIQRLGPSAERLNRVKQYLSVKNPNPMAFVTWLEDAQATATGPATFEADLVKRFIDSGGLTRREALIALATKLQTPEGQGVLSAALKRGPLVVWSDRDGDGYAETMYRFQNGTLVGLERDPNQAGQMVERSEWQGGRPNRLALTDRTTGRVIVLDYAGHYPFAPRVLATGQNTILEFRGDYRSVEETWVDLADDQADPIALLQILSPNKIQLTFNDLLDRSAEMVVRLAEPKGGGPSPAIVRAQLATKVPALSPDWLAPPNSPSQDRNLDGSILAVVKLVKGQIVSAKVDETGRGVFDHLYVYDRGEPVLGFREIDGQGVFRVVEQYSQGKLSAVHYEGEGWAYQIKATSGLAVWDLNGDLRLDTTELRQAIK